MRRLLALLLPACVAGQSTMPLSTTVQDSLVKRWADRVETREDNAIKAAAFSAAARTVLPC